MNRPLIAAAVALSLLGVQAHAQTAAPAPAAAAATDGTININLRGMRVGKGSVILMLFNNDSDYEASKPMQTSKLDVTASVMQGSFTGVTPGHYAIKAFYDVNNNGAFDPGVDSAGFSNHASMSDENHMPNFSEAEFTVKAGVNNQQISFQH